MQTKFQPSVLRPGEGKPINLGPNRLHVKVSPELGSSYFSMFESTFPPGAGAFPHLHHSYDEAFYVLRGEVEYRLGDEQVVVGPGYSIFVPAGTVHSFTNVGTVDATILGIHSPGQALHMIEELSQVPPSRSAEVLARYDSEVVTG